MNKIRLTKNVEGYERRGLTKGTEKTPIRLDIEGNALVLTGSGRVWVWTDEFKEIKMDEDDGKLLIFHEVDMQDVVDKWAEEYAEGVEVSRWYYDCHSQTLVVGLLAEGQDGDVIRGVVIDEPED